MRHIAIIGSGISGLTAAYLLSKKHNVTVFERDSRIGGHTATVDVEKNGRQYAIDTGFIVFNDRTYPNFLKLLSEIGIDKNPTEMSFSVQNCNTGLEYNGHNLNTLFAQRRNLFNVNFWQLIREILRFNKLCLSMHQQQSYASGQQLGSFLAKYQFSRYFAEHYILPMGAAIWSTSLVQMEQFDVKFFIQFFKNHGLLSVNNRPQWYVVPQGSRSYLAPLCQPFNDNIVLNSNITGITRSSDKVYIQFDNQDVQAFDDVVISCHSDQALALLKDATSEEKHILGDMPYNANDVVLHTDINLLPKQKRAWASWNYQLSNERNRPASLTYNMNILQGIDSEDTFCVTLNQSADIEEASILKSFVYHHPVFSEKFIQAQQRRDKICGKGRTHFAGAYWYNGFHEDGVRSAVDVAKRFDCHLTG